MKSALITGANKSIGYEIARQLLSKGYYVYLGSRNVENGLKAVEKLKAEYFDNVEMICIDVTDQDSVKTARVEIGEKTDVLDVLINNAGISGGMPQSAIETDMDVFKKVFETNLFGVIRVTQVFMDLLRKSDEPRIVNVTSGMGSMTLHSDPTWESYQFKAPVYDTSKAALNMYTIQLAYELRDTPFRVNAVDPGFTKTDFNNNMGTAPVELGASRIVKYILINNDGPTGGYFSQQNNPETEVSPW